MVTVKNYQFSKFTHSFKNINPSVAMFSNQTLVVPSAVMLNCRPQKVLMCVCDKVRELHMQQCDSFTQKFSKFTHLLRNISPLVALFTYL